MTEQELKNLSNECKNVKNYKFDEQHYAQMFKFFGENKIIDLAMLILTKFRDVKIENNSLVLKNKNNIKLSIDLETLQGNIEVAGKSCRLLEYLNDMSEQVDKYSNSKKRIPFEEALMEAVTMAGIAYTMIEKSKGSVNQDFLGFLDCEPENGLFF